MLSKTRTDTFKQIEHKMEKIFENQMYELSWFLPQKNPPQQFQATVEQKNKKQKNIWMNLFMVYKSY